MHRPLLRAVALLVGLAGCAPPFPALRTRLLIGIEPIRAATPWTGLLTERLLVDLAALPNTMVVDLGPTRNQYGFAAEGGAKLRLMTTSLAGPFCLDIRTTLFRFGHLDGHSGLLIRAEPGHPTPTDCIDLAATQIYDELVRQGL